MSQKLIQPNQIVTSQMCHFGPLHEKRYEIEKLLIDLPIQTGDVLYRASNAKGPLGLPFSKIVALLSKSVYSHAAIAISVNGKPFVLEINDQGTLLYRMIDWIETTYTGEFSVYRYKKINEDLQEALKYEIEDVLAKDPEYDFTFDDPEKFYCTESVAVIYSRVGLNIFKGSKIKDVVPLPIYYVIRLGNFFMKMFDPRVGLPFKNELFFVGNKNHGMMSSPEMKEVFHYAL